MNEKDLSVVLGVSRDHLKVMRDSFKEGVHWTRKESKKPKHLWTVEWTEMGQEALRTELGLHVKEDAMGMPPENKSGTVQAKYKNTRILGVLVDGKAHNVLCRDSSKFGIGMQVELKWDGVRWCVAKHPRFLGKY